MAVLIFALLGSVTPEDTRTRADEIKNGLFSMIAFVLGATTSILCGYLGMKIATYANARTAIEARKGIAPAFMCGECVPCTSAVAYTGRGVSCVTRSKAAAVHTSACPTYTDIHRQQNVCARVLRDVRGILLTSLVSVVFGLPLQPSALVL